MKILLLVPFFTGSHKAWAEGYKKHSSHEVEIFGLAGRHWKWRMHGSAITFAQKLRNADFKPDRIITSDMMDVALFKAIANVNVPIYSYFHENQLTYPWSPTDEDTEKGRDKHYGFINYTTALASDKVFFNSQFHKDSFLAAAKGLLRSMPDHQNVDTIEAIESKSSVLYLGMDLHKFDAYKKGNVPNKIPVILWNHRWEYDKNPEEFFETLIELKDSAIDFKLIVLGQSYGKVPPIFDKAKQELADRIIHFGFADSFEAYAKYLCMADILPVTNIQDFFGGSIVEAMYCDVYPLLPNRLTYPELLASNFHPQHIYDEKLKPALQHLLETWSSYDSSNIAHEMKKFDWQEIVMEYEEVFEKR